MDATCSITGDDEALAVPLPKIIAGVVSSRALWN